MRAYAFRSPKGEERAPFSPLAPARPGAGPARPALVPLLYNRISGEGVGGGKDLSSRESDIPLA